MHDSGSSKKSSSGGSGNGRSNNVYRYGSVDRGRDNLKSPTFSFTPMKVDTTSMETISIKSNKSPYPWENDKPSVIEDESESEEKQQQMRRQRYLLLAIALVLIPFTVYSLVTVIVSLDIIPKWSSFSSYISTSLSTNTTAASTRYGTSNTRLLQQGDVSNTPSLAFSVWNEYTVTSPLSGYYPWSLIIEPYRNTTFSIDSNTVRALNRMGVTCYRWTIDDTLLGIGTEMTTMVTLSTGVYTLLLSAYTTSTPSASECSSSDTSTLQLVTETSETVAIKYVRRELRGLNEYDRTAFFQALSIIQRVPTQVGKSLYGEKYRSKDFFNRMHLYYGGMQDCDHWHAAGTGFTTSHFTLHNMYEQSLQSINPSIALPYWDFTIESTMFEPSTFRDSIIFAEGWFGDGSADNDLHTVITGRFAYIPVMQNAENYSRVISPYGQLRATTNAVPIPYMIRSAVVYDIENTLKPSGCVEYKVVLDQRTWATFAKEMLVGGHGHLHELLGGSFGMKMALKNDETLTDEDPAYWGRYAFAHRSEGATKTLWRKGYMTCPTYGSPECPVTASESYKSKIERDEHYKQLMKSSTSSSSLSTKGNIIVNQPGCMCKCTADMYKDNSQISTILYNAGILSGLKYYDVTKNLFLEDFVHYDEETGKMHYKVIDGYTAAESNAMYGEIRDYLCDMGHIGDNYQATSTNDPTFWVMHTNMERVWHLIRLNTVKEYVTFNETWDNALYESCVGQRTTDATPFKNIYDNSDIVYTNSELYDLLDPARDDLPFVYDNFRMHHCEVLNYDMTGTEEV